MRIALWALAAVVVLLALSQLLLPSIAASRISGRLSRYGSVQSVSVSAWPAIELLWGSAGSVTVHARSLRLTPARSASLIGEASGAARMDVTVATLWEGPLRMTEAVLAKRGSSLAGSATAAAADVAAALPPGVGVTLLGSSGGRVTVRVSGGLFGLRAGIDAVGEARGGRLLAHPAGSSLLGGVQLTLFSDPGVQVTAIAARALATWPPSYRLSMTARQR